MLREFAERAERQTDGIALELLPRRGRHERRGDGLARRPGAGGGPALDGRRGRVEVDHRARHRRLRPPADRHVAAVPARPRRCTTWRHGARPWPAAPGAGRGAPRPSASRRSVDLEHWAAFQQLVPRRLPSFSAPSAPASAASAPASIVTLSGDVHHAYLFEVAFPRGSGVRSAVWQAVCSPYRNPLDSQERLVIRLGMSRPLAAVARAGGPRGRGRGPEGRWRLAGDGPWFDNQVAMLIADGRGARHAAREGGSGRRGRAPGWSACSSGGSPDQRNSRPVGCFRCATRQWRTNEDESASCAVVSRAGTDGSGRLGRPGEAGEGHRLAPPSRPPTAPRSSWRTPA